MTSQQILLDISEDLKGSGDNSDVKKQNIYVPGQKCGKWSDQQHMKYIVFIDYHKEKMRSKQKRRSNKFYEQMSKFIRTRNSLQCRSHHQKLEEKYTHVNKIINTFKHYFDRKTYKHHLDSLDFFATNTSIKSQINDIQMNSVQVQTDLSDIRTEFIFVQPNLVMLQTKKQSLPIQPHPQVTLIPNNMYTNINISTSHPIMPTYPMGQVGYWNFYLPHQA